LAIRGQVSIRMRDCRIAVVVALGLLPAGLFADTKQQDYQALIDEYRRGNAEAVVSKIAALGSQESERLRPTLALEEAPWDWAALILLRAEAKHRYWNSVWAWESLSHDGDPYVDLDRWEAPSLRTLQALKGHALRTGDERLLEYCREWYINALHGFGNADSFDGSRDLFPSDPLVLLARGRYLEFWMGPETEEAGPGAVWLRAGDEGEPRFRTAHGVFGPYASRAIDTYRDALKIDPRRAEARLRLGRVLYLLERNDDALRELERTLVDARKGGHGETAYLAALFAGQVHEFVGRQIEAAASYREAMTLCPSCPSAPTALLRLQLASGRMTEGWEGMDDLLQHVDEPSAVATDPWLVYTIRPGSFLQAQRYVALRPWIRVR